MEPLGEMVPQSVCTCLMVRYPETLLFIQHTVNIRQFLIVSVS